MTQQHYRVARTPVKGEARNPHLKGQNRPDPRKNVSDLRVRRGALPAGLLHDLLGQVGGELLVAQELHRVVALPARDRAQVGGVA